MSEERSKHYKNPLVHMNHRCITEEDSCTFRSTIKKFHSSPKWVVHQRNTKKKREQSKKISQFTKKEEVSPSEKTLSMSKVQQASSHLKTNKPTIRTKCSPVKETTNLAHRLSREAINILEVFHANAMKLQDDDQLFADSIVACVQGVAKKLELLTQIPISTLIDASQCAPSQRATVERNEAKPSMKNDAAFSTPEPKQSNRGKSIAELHGTGPVEVQLRRNVFVSNGSFQDKRASRSSLPFVAINEVLIDVNGTIIQPNIKSKSTNILPTSRGCRMSEMPASSQYATSSNHKSASAKYGDELNRPRRLNICDTTLHEFSFEDHKKSARNSESFDKWCADFACGDL